MSEKYCPSNGTEGLWFTDNWCDRCEKDRVYRETQDGADGCLIVCSSMAYDVDSPEYPTEWIYDKDNKPCCTAFIPEGEEIPYRCDKTVDMFSINCGEK